MKFYRICSDPFGYDPYFMYAETFAGAKDVARGMTMYADTLIVDLVEVPTDKKSVQLLLNGAEPSVGDTLAAWTLTKRGGLKRMSDAELAEYNDGLRGETDSQPKEK
jgi:hypothetical protein